MYVVDIFDFNGSLIPGLHRFVGDNPVLLVGNKEDLLPRSLRRSKLTDWLRQQANQAGFDRWGRLWFPPRKIEIEALLDQIEQLRGDRDVYVVGGYERWEIDIDQPNYQATDRRARFDYDFALSGDHVG